MVASNVIGQPDFRTTGTTSAGAATLNNPTGVTFDAINNRLFVADGSYNRVLVYNTSTITNGMSASYVLGQSNTTNSAASCTQAGIDGIPGIGSQSFDAVNERLFVTDRTGSRVLVYNVATGSIATGENASNVLGPSGYTTCSLNQGGSVSQSSIGRPTAPAFDPADQLLYVTDQNNNRVLVFNVATGNIANGENASYELGQPSGTAFTSSSTATTQSGMNSPAGAAFDPNTFRLFVADENNYRVLVFNVQPAYISNGENASFVIGQATFTSGSANQGVASTPTQSSLYLITAGGNPVAYDPATTKLFVTDYTNQRLMIFDGTTLPPADYYVP
jgi:DNA-binding beta-propeller fold protein YncE